VFLFTTMPNAPSGKAPERGYVSRRWGWLILAAVPGAAGMWATAGAHELYPAYLSILTMAAALAATGVASVLRIRWVAAFLVIYAGITLVIQSWSMPSGTLLYAIRELDRPAFVWRWFWGLQALAPLLLAFGALVPRAGFHGMGGPAMPPLTRAVAPMWVAVGLMWVFLIGFSYWSAISSGRCGREIELRYRRKPAGTASSAIPGHMPESRRPA
jgi:hypothetical protein